MQCPMLISMPSLMTNPLKDAAKVDAVDCTSEFESLYCQMEDFLNYMIKEKQHTT